MTPFASLTVVHILDSLAPGGLENGVVNVARRLHGQGFDIHAACLRFRGDFADRMPEQGNVVVLGKQQGFSLKATLRLLRYLVNVRADVIHSHNLGTLIYAILATFGGLLCPIVHGEHGQLQPEDLRPKRLKQRRWLFRLCKKLHVVSSSVRDNLVQLGLCAAPQVVVTPNGVDCDRYSPPASIAAVRQQLGFGENDTVIGIVGRLVALKRHRMLFEAFASLANAMPSLRLLVVGDGGADREDIIEAMRTHPFADRIQWSGHQNDLRPYYQSMSLLAAPSEIEGLSNAVLEAMACGVPVLAHSACGNAEVIDDNVSGFLRQIDSAEILARDLRDVLGDPARLARCSTAARETVMKRFSMEAMLESYRQLYRSAARR
jgi:glycosyltransferase involved in cell wall biosynthesis